VERLDRADSHTDDLNHPELELEVPTTREVLEELFQLLEDYGPTWYTEKHHDRAVAALQGRPV
jgi:prephenate dehydrogenase